MHVPGSPNDAPVRVLFLCQRPESWVNVRSAWEAMRDDARFAPELLVLPYNHSAKGTPRAGCDAMRALFDGLGLPYRDSERDGFELRANAYDVAIFNAPYDLERPPAFHFDVVAAKVRHTIYVPYGLAVGAGDKNRSYQYAQPTQIHARSVIARSHLEKALYARHCPSGSDHVRVLGLPRMDELHDIDRFEVDPALNRAIGDRFAVLWNSHFSFGQRRADGLCYSSFDVLASGLFAFAADNRDVAVIWRPHPGLFPALFEEGLLRPDQLARLHGELESAGIVLDQRADHRHAFAASHALMTDPGSFLIEYLGTGKPLAYLYADGSEGLNEEGTALQRGIDTARGADEAVQFIERMRQARGTPQERYARLRERFLPGMDGSAGRRLASHLLDLMHGRTTQELPEPADEVPLPPEGMAAPAEVCARTIRPLDADRYPTLAALCEGLDDLHRRKQQARAARGSWHDAGSSLRASLSEGLKRRPRLMRLLLRATRRL